MFLQLYAQATWGRTALDEQELALCRTMTDEDWQQVIDQASRQTVVGLVTNSISRLPQDVRPDKAIYFKAIYQTMEIENANQRMNALLPQLFELLQGKQLKAWLLKGQGVGRCYENPLLRQAGDIDLFFPRMEDFECADRLFARKARKEDTGGQGESSYSVGGILVELHSEIVSNLNPKMKRHFKAFLKHHAEGGEEVRWETPRGVVVMPPCHFDVLFIFIHLTRHYIGGGVGLRQVTDWMRYLYHNREQIDRRRLMEDIAHLGLGKLWKAFAAMAVDELGFPEAHMPGYEAAHAPAGRTVLACILQVGNFGHYNKDTQSESGQLMVRKTVAFWGHLKLMLRNVRLFPVEMLWSIPPYLGNGFERTFAAWKVKRASGEKN